MANKKSDDLIKEMGDFEVSELDDKDLEDAAGGTEAVEFGPNTNCGCGGHDFRGEAGAQNINCGCPGLV